MAERIKGITVEIGSDTSPLSKAVDNANKKIKSLQKELRGVNTLQKGDPNSLVLQSQKQELVSKSVEATKEKLELLKSKQSEVTVAFEKYKQVAPKIQELGEKINATKEKLKDLKAEQDKAKEAFDKGEISKEKYEEIKNKVKDTQNALTDLKAEQNKLSEGTVNAEQYRDYQREIVKTEQDLKALEAQQKKTSRLNFNASIKSVESFGSKCERVGRKLKVVSAAAAGILTVSVKNASEYDESVAKVSTLTDKTILSNEKLSKGILKISDDIGKSNTDIAEATYQALSASVDTGNALKFTASAAKLAKAGFTETATSVDVLTTIENAYNISADKTNKIADMLVNTQNKGKTTVGELGSAMGRVIPTAASMNVSIEQLCTGYAELTKRGINTANATTYMNSLLDELGKSSSVVAKLLKKETGKSFAELSKEGKTLGDVIKILATGAKKTNTSFNDLFKKSSARKAALTLLDVGAKEFNKSLKDMKNCTGVVDKALEDLQTPSTKAKKSVNELKNVSVKFGESLLSSFTPTIQSVSEKISKLSEHWDNLSDEQKQTIGTILKITAVASPALILLGKGISGTAQLVMGLKTSIASLGAKTVATEVDTAATVAATGATGALGVAMNALPLVAIGTAIVGVVSALATFASSNDECAIETQKLNEQIEKNRQALKEQNEQIDKSAVKQLSQTENTESLINELEKLVGKNREVKKSDKARVDFIQGELKKALGDEYDSLDKIIDKHGKVIKAVREEIRVQKAKIILEAEQKKSQGAIESEKELKKTESDAFDKLIKAQQKYNPLKKEYNSLVSKQNEAETILNNARKNGIKENDKAYKILKSYGFSQKQLNEILSAGKDALYESSSAQTVLKNNLTNAEDELGKWINEHGEDYQKAKTDVEDYQTTYDKAHKDVINNQKEQDNYLKMSEWWNGGAYDKIINSTDWYSAKIKDVTKASNKKLINEYNSLNDKIKFKLEERNNAKNESEKKAINKSLKNLQKEQNSYKKQLEKNGKIYGKDFEKNYAEGIKENSGKIEESSKNVAKKSAKVTKTAFNNALKSNTTETNKATSNGLIQPISTTMGSLSTKNKFKSKAQTLKLAVGSGFKDTSISKDINSSNSKMIELLKYNKPKYVTVGNYLMQGIGAGIDGGLDFVCPALSRVSTSIVSKLRSLFKINSPSKLIEDEVGIYLPMALAVSVDKGTGNILKSIENQSAAIMGGYTDMAVKAKSIMSAFALDVPEEYFTTSLGSNFQLAVQHTFAKSQSGQSTAQAVESLNKKVDEVIDKIPTALLLDGERLVGGTVDKTDRRLSERQIMASRGLPS